MNTSCPSDLTDAQWQIVAPLLAVERAQGRVGRPRKYSNRQIINAIFYLVRTGSQWRYLPSDYPPYGCVFWYFRKWRDNGTLERVHHVLRHQVRVQAGKKATPFWTVKASRQPKKGQGQPRTNHRL